jgi:hypothetical protein
MTVSAPRLRRQPPTRPPTVKTDAQLWQLGGPALGAKRRGRLHETPSFASSFPAQSAGQGVGDAVLGGGLTKLI